MTAPTGFIDAPRFPDCISAGSGGGPNYRTDIIELESGHERRNQRWAIGRHQYNAAFGVRHLEDLEELRDFFHVCAGRAFGFRFKDFADFQSCPVDALPAATDQVIGTADGTTTQFQLVKRYTVGGFERVRPITRPVAGTVVIAINGADVGAGWTLDATTGVVTFATAPPAAPGADVVSAGYMFDVPVRFATDSLEVNWEHYRAGTTDVPLMEEREP